MCLPVKRFGDARLRREGGRLTHYFPAGARYYLMILLSLLMILLLLLEGRMGGSLMGGDQDGRRIAGGSLRY